MNPSLLDNISLRDIPTILPLLTTAEQEQLLAQLSHLEKLKHKTLVQKKFIEFVHHVWGLAVRCETLWTKRTTERCSLA